MSDHFDQDLVVYRGETKPFLFSPATPTDVTGSAFAFSLSTRPGNVLVAGYPVAGVIVSPSAGTFTVTVTTGGLAAGTTYSFDVFETDSDGFVQRVAGGTLRYREAVRRP